MAAIATANYRTYTSELRPRQQASSCSVVIVKVRSKEVLGIAYYLRQATGSR